MQNIFIGLFLISYRYNSLFRHYDNSTIIIIALQLRGPVAYRKRLQTISPGDTEKYQKELCCELGLSRTVFQTLH